MATPLPIPEYAVTGGSYWPGAGSIPKANDSDYYQITRSTSATMGGYLIQAKSNPGVDPVYLDTLPILLPKRFIYIPILGTIHQIAIVRQPIEGYGVDGLSASLVFMQGQEPSALVADTPTDIRVIDMGAPPLKVQNIGAGNCTIDGANIVPGQWIMVTSPVVYDDGASTLAIAKNW